MPIIIHPTSKEHWLEMKHEDVSSTEVAALFELSPYTTAFELYHSKRQETYKSFEDNERMLCGRVLEDPIAKMAADSMGVKVRRLKSYMRHDEVKRMGSSFDYEIVGDLSESALFKKNPHLKGAGLLEVKNVDSLIYRNEWSEDEAPPHIETQVQHEMEVANRDWTIIACLVGGNSLKMILRERNRKVGKALCEAVNDFWADVKSNNEPTPNFERDANFILSMYEVDGKEPYNMSDDIELKSLVLSYKTLRDRYNELEKATTAIKAEVIYRIGGAPKIFTKDGLTVNTSMTKNTLPTLITEEMVGMEIGGRHGYRQFRVTQKKVS